MTRLGVTLPEIDCSSSTLTFEALGRDLEWGQTVQNPGAAGGATVRLRTAAVTVPAAGSGAAPVTLTEIVPPGAIGRAALVSSSRCDVGIGT